MKPKRVCIDAGHGRDNAAPGRYDPGAVCGGVQEASVALAYALELEEACGECGVEAFVTRRSARDAAPLHLRPRRALSAGCALLLSLHANASSDPTAHGVEALYGHAGSRSMALRCAGAVSEALGLRDRGAKRRAGLAALRFNAGPAVLLELGFLTNSGDLAALLDEERRPRACRRLALVLSQSSSG
jgi:N-acetylmuramoyl-L-alanine amidase